jgi:eukaryotic-like serine/threonine-protein kinase
MSGTAPFGSPPRRRGTEPTQPLEAIASAPSDNAEPEPVEDVLTGTSYRVIRKIDEGGMGTVYLAEHRDLGRRFAVKVIHPELSPTPDVVERLRREARAASRIRHPGIVDVTDFGTTASGRSFVVMEHIEGPTLARLLSEHGPINQRETVALALKICDALGAAHAGDVIHRDVKPENIVLLEGDDLAERAIKVIDFGLALSAEHAGARLTRQGVVFGTPEYMSPEQVRGGRVTPASDVYSLGVVLYEMLSGKLPFGAETAVETMATKLHEPPPPIEEVAPGTGVHPALEQVVLRCMEPVPDDRFGSMAELADALATALDEIEAAEPSDESTVGVALAEARPAVGTGSLERPATRRGPIAALMIVGIVAIGAAVAFVSMSGRDDGPRAEPGATARPVERPSPAAIEPQPEPAATDRVEPPSGPSTIDRDAAPAPPRPDAAPAVVGNEPRPITPRPGRDVGAEPAESQDRAQRAAAALEEGQQLLRRRQLGPARAAFEHALELVPASPEAQAGLGRIAFEEGRYGDAVTRLERALRGRPGDAGLRVALGSAYLRNGDRAHAIEQWQRVLATDPDNAAARRALEGVGAIPPASN